MYIDKRPQSENGNKPGDDPEDEDRKTIFCANLNEKITEEILYELFIQGGPVESVHIAKDKDGRKKSFAFVTFCHSCSVPYALDLFDGVKLYNQRLVLKPKQSSNNTARSFANPPASKFHIGNDTRNDNKNFSDNSVLRMGGSRALNQKNDPNLKPKEPEPKLQKKNPFNVELLSRLGADFLINSSIQNNNGNKISRNNERGGTSKRASRRNKPHNQNNPYKRPESSKGGNWNQGHTSRDRPLNQRRR